MIIVVWLSMAALNIPTAVWGELQYNPLQDASYCVFSRRLDPTVVRIYVLSTHLISYVIPLIIMWTAYIGIACIVKRSANKVTRLQPISDLHTSKSSG
jgi:7 transmembrane receptor (rhodopsin family)